MISIKLAMQAKKKKTVRNIPNVDGDWLPGPPIFLVPLDWRVDVDANATCMQPSPA
jgi:hypothetical protein